MAAQPSWIEKIFGRLTIQINGSAFPSRGNLNFKTPGFTAADNPANDSIDVTADATITVNDATMHDADYAVTQTSGDTYVGSDTAFTANRTLTLKSSAAVGSRVTWYDEATGTPSLSVHSLIVALDGAGNVQRKNTSASTLSLSLGDVGDGGSIQFLKVSSTLWKALS